ncbi:helix-turn-helix transcriptional regulator [Methanococcoides sp. FTZ1]|uniref:helix-turn-helix transcriptional regulator n=1 Tax=Methanococcoides sp. FTZ1 TaxID=3439061 RepID=UPI003F842708
MHPEIYKTIWFSERRQKLLYFIEKGPANIDKIKSEFGLNSRLIVPDLKKLKKQNIIVENDCEYSLSNIGTLIVANMHKLANISTLIEKNPDFWEHIDLSSIPKELYLRLGDLKEYKLNIFKIEDAYEPPTELLEAAHKSSEINIYMPFFPPQFPEHFLNPLERGVDISIVHTPNFIEKFNSIYPSLLKKYLDAPNVKFFQCNAKLNYPMLITMDNFLLMGFFTENGSYYPNEITNNSKVALKWGNELFEYYIEHSTSINKETIRGMGANL